MITNYTNNLIKLAYREADPLKTLTIIEDIENNVEVKEHFNMITEMKKELDLLKCNPSDASIDFILKYSQKRGLVVS